MERPRGGGDYQDEGTQWMINERQNGTISYGEITINNGGVIEIVTTILSQWRQCLQSWLQLLSRFRYV